MSPELEKLQHDIREISDGLEALQYTVAKKTGVGSTLEADLGTLGNWKLATNSITAGEGSATVGLDATVTASDDVRIYAGSATPASAPFRVTEAGALTATSATITGSITATTGTIGGFTVGTDYVKDAADSMGMASTVTGGDDVRFWAGDTFANRATADFRVTEAGAVTGSSVTITGGSVASSILSGLVPLANENVAAQGWTQTCAFTVTDADTVAWASGTFTTAAGTAYSITGSNTGNMAAKTYVYLDIGVSTTAYQTTTTAATAVGSGKVLIAVAQNNTTEAVFQVFGGAGGLNIDAASIVASSITANEIAASTITAGKLSVSQLSAIAADMGAITAGTIVLPSGGYVRSGQTAYATGTGWYIGNDSGTSKFSIGSSTKFVTWDGSTLTVEGTLIADITVFTASDTLRASADTVRNQDISITSWTTRKQFTVYYPGTIRVKHDTKTGGTGGAQISSRIQINGVDAAGPHDNATGSYVTYSDDVTVAVGDIVTIDTKGNGTVDTGSIRNGRVYYDLSTSDPSVVDTD